MRFIKRVIIIASFLFAILHASFSFAQFPAISNGLSYLVSSQTSTGFWGDADEVPYNSLVETCAIADSLKIIGGADASYASAIQWINATTADNNDYLFAQLVSLAQAGQDVSSIENNLLNARNADGGWGVGEGITSDIKRTALALQALHAANYSDTTLIGQSLNYLTSNQNFDGGWGFTAGDASNTYVTSIVLGTLSAYNSVFINQTAINNASAFLLAHQNSDGGFGSSPSTVYETSLSLISLIQSGKGSVQTVQNGVNYLTTAQASDGSWNQDPYSTALALQALAAARPNLAVATTDIAFSNNMPQAGDTVTITATVHNTGYDNASNVVVRFYNGDPSAGGTQISADQMIPLIALGSSAQASVSTSFSTTGGKTIFAVVDPDNLVSETSKLDNKASNRLWVATAPDLAVYSEDLKPSTFVPAPGTAFTLAYTVRNLGETGTGAFDVALYDGDPSTGSGHLLSTANVSGINGNDVRMGTFGVTLSQSGAHTLYVVADSGNAITETSETNNTGSVTVQVGGSITGADLAVTPMDITLNPARPHAGDTVTITANYRNQGTDQATGFLVEIYDGAPESGGTLIASQTATLAAGGQQIITANWTMPSGVHDVYVVLDRDNRIIETNETDNRARITVMADMVDIEISATDLTFSPAYPVNGDSVLLSVAVHNLGIKDTGPFNLALYDGDPAQGGALLQTYPISDIAADGSATVSYSFTAVPWIYRFYAVADPENKVVELTKTDNTAIRSLTILGPGQSLGPDLAPTKLDLTDTTTDPQTLSITGPAHVTFQNKGDEKITTAFQVLVFEDMDGDGIYTPGVDNLLGTGTNTVPLWPQGASVVDVPLTGAVKFLHSPLYAFVDSTDVIREQNEDNNLIKSGSDCEVVPPNPIQPVIKWKKTGMWLHSPPAVGPLIDTNGDGKIDQNDVPAVVFVEGVPYWGGKLWAVRGDNGNTIFSFYDAANHPMAQAHTPVAIADVDGDGLPEVVANRSSVAYTNYDYCGLMVFDHTGNLKWDNAAKVSAWNSARGVNYCQGAGYNNSATIDFVSPQIIADLDHDGHPEIIVGSTVVDSSDGTIKWSRNLNQNDGFYSFYGNGTVFASTVADLDLDGKEQIIAGNAAFYSDGTVKWWNARVINALNAVGKFGDDSYPEIVAVEEYTGNVYFLDHDGRILWGPVSIKSFEPANPYPLPITNPPVIADFDGDGQNEIGVRGNSNYYVLDKNGHLKHSYPILQDYENPSPATVFDLNGDGKPEVLLTTAGYLRIYDGKTGTVLYQDYVGTSPQAVMESNLHKLMVADVDGDGKAEVVVISDDGIRVYGSRNQNWTDSRTVWNQYDYHVTNVNDDGTIPQYESPSWLLNNTFRAQTAIGPNPNPYLTANLTASDLRTSQIGSAVNLTVRIGNGGATSAPAGVPVTFYTGTPGSGMLIGSSATTKTLNPGDYEDITFTWQGGVLGEQQVYASVNGCSSGSNCISECRTDDNQVQTGFTLGSNLPDLKVGPEDVTLPAEPYAEGSVVPITVSVKNLGPVSASNVHVRLYNGNPASGGTQIGTDQIIPSISAFDSADDTLSFDTLDKPGSNVLYIVVDPDNTVQEINKDNNTASVTINVTSPSLPNLAITAADIQITPAAPRQGDAVTITATIHNRGAAVGNIPVRFYLGDPASGGTIISDQTVYSTLYLGDTAAVQAVLNTTGINGQQNIFVVIDPVNTITESTKDDNMASTSISVLPAAVTSTLSLDQTQYPAQTDMNITLTVQNNSQTVWSGTGSIVIEDSAGNRLAQAGTFDVDILGPHHAAPFLAGWSNRTQLILDHTKITGQLVNFPVRIRLGTASGENGADTSYIFTALGSNRKKIAITASDGQTQCNVEIDRWDPQNKIADLWVKVPAISSSADTVLYLYYDPAQNDNNAYVGDSGSVPAQGVWDNDYKAVYHLSQDPSGTAPQIIDSTVNANNGSAVGGMTTGDLVAAEANKGLLFDGSNDRINVPGAGSLNFTSSFTAEVLVKTLTDYSSGGHSLLGKAADSGSPALWKMMVFGPDTGHKQLMGYIQTTSGEIRVGQDPYNWTTNTWYHLTMTYSKTAGQLKFFLNGAQLGSTVSRSENMITSSRPMTLGNGWWAGSWVDFTNEVLDEASLSDVARTPDWIRARYASLNDNLISYGDVESMNPPSVGTYAFTWNTGSVLSGNYQVHTILSDETRAVSENRAAFDILPDLRAAAQVVTDKISYNPNDTVTLTATAASLSANYVFAGLTAVTKITGPTGAVVSTDTKTLANLMPGSSLSFKTYWPVAASATGTYTCTLTILNGQVALATSSASFQVLGTSTSGSGLLGTVTATYNPVDFGKNEALTYSITNNGNEDISNLAVKVLIVNPDTGNVEQSFASTAGIPLGQAVTESVIVPTTGLSLRSYIAVLQGQLTGMTQPKTLASAVFTVKSSAPPVVTILSPSAGSLYNTTISISATATSIASTVASVQYQVDGGAWNPLPLVAGTTSTYGTSWTPAAADNGNHTISFRATDSYGNTSLPVSVSFTIDTIPPVTTIAVGTPKYETSGKIFITSGSAITLSATDNLSGVAQTQYRIDGGPWTAYGPFSISTEGSHVIEYGSKDKAGNQETTRNITLIVDNTAPVTTITVGTPQYTSADGKLYATSATTFTLSAGDNLSAAAKTEYQVDGGAWSVYSAFTVTTEGTHTVNYRSTDNVGNIETARAQTIIIDNTPPVTTISASDPLADGVVNTVSPSTYFTLTSTDNLSGVRTISYSIDNGEWQMYTGSFFLTGLAAGQHTISFKAIDNVLNEESPKSITVRLVIINVEKKISHDPVILAWVWNDKSDAVQKQSDATALSTLLSQLGVTYHIATDRDDFASALRSGRYNTYILIDAKEPLVGEEIREAIRYGDGLIFIKTRPDADPFSDDLFGMTFTGNTSSKDLLVNLVESPISNGGTIRSRGKTVVGAVTAATAQTFGTVADKTHGDPAIVFNQYGRGRSLMYTFDLLNSPDQAQASALLVNSINFVLPLEHYLRALDSAPVRIRLSNSSEPVDLKVTETIPDGTTADTMTPQTVQKDNSFTWLKSLSANEKATFGYYLNLPDLTGDYTAKTDVSYGNNGIFRPYGGHELTLTVQNSSSDLLQGVLADLKNITMPNVSDAEKIEKAIDSLTELNTDASTVKDALDNIADIITATDDVRALSSDTSDLRLKLDELLKIWEKKWYMLESAQ